ncbi:DNA -binding domain-containing protein [Novosphingobium aquae]|uniref:DUF2285 domain-containing protein n=1 Tax=Novosphingobium aquae TaxID=3133435 RepID=A0ABU8SA08_9SPHN
MHLLKVAIGCEVFGNVEALFRINRPFAARRMWAFHQAEQGVQRLWLNDHVDGQGLACSILTDGAFGIRLAAAKRFQQRLAGCCTSSQAGCLFLTSFQHSRLALMLRIIDFLAEASDISNPVRETARHIAFPHSVFANANEWKTSSERR